MAYSIQADLENSIQLSHLVELTDDLATGSIVETVITRAIEDADSEIDIYCRKKYIVPLTVTNEVRKMSVDIAIYNLYSRRESPPADRLVRYLAAVEKLKAIRDGDIQLDIAEVGPDSAAIDVKPEFTRGKVDVDGNLLGDMMGQWDLEGGSLDDW